MSASRPRDNQRRQDAAVGRSTRQISYGEWEPDPDALPVYDGMVSFLGGPITLRPRTGGWRRARYESWDENGQRMGMRTWERRLA